METRDGTVPGLAPTARFSDFQPVRFVIPALFWYDSEKPECYDKCGRINMEVAKRLSEPGGVHAER